MTSGRLTVNDHVKVSRTDSTASDIEVISIDEVPIVDTESPVEVCERTAPFCAEDWPKCLDSDGRVIHELALRKAVFKGQRSVGILYSIHRHHRHTQTQTHTDRHKHIYIYIYIYVYI